MAVGMPSESNTVRRITPSNVLLVLMGITMNRLREYEYSRTERTVGVGGGKERAASTYNTNTVRYCQALEEASRLARIKLPNCARMQAVFATTPPYYVLWGSTRAHIVPTSLGGKKILKVSSTFSHRHRHQQNVLS